MVGGLLTSPGRLLHPLRRRAARQMLKGRAPRSILVVCHGNICRSPFAAALLLRALGPLGVRVDSAGFVRPHRPAPPEALAAAARRGVDLSDHRSRLLTPDLARSAELIVVMDPVQEREVRERFGRASSDVVVLGDLDPAPLGGARAIRDPIGQGPEVFEASYARIERCVGELARALGRAGG
jgi:protein-tyrosine-phosphatase